MSNYTHLDLSTPLTTIPVVLHVRNYKDEMKLFISRMDKVVFTFPDMEGEDDDIADCLNLATSIGTLKPNKDEKYKLIDALKDLKVMLEGYDLKFDLLYNTHLEDGSAEKDIGLVKSLHLKENKEMVGFPYAIVNKLLKVIMGYYVVNLIDVPMSPN